MRSSYKWQGVLKKYKIENDNVSSPPDFIQDYDSKVAREMRQVAKNVQKHISHPHP
jgi:hypothetical protein